MEPKHSLVQHLKLRYLDGWSKLHVAAHEGDLPKVLSLLPKLFSEEQLNSRTKSKFQSPLHLACAQGHYAVAAELMDRNAKLTCIDKNLRTPLHLAAMFGHDKLCSLLVQGQGNGIGRTPKASERSFLLQSMDSEGNTAFLIAVKYGRVDCMRTLAKLGADVTSLDGAGAAALHIAAHNSDLVMMEALLPYTDINTVMPHKGATALHIAAAHGDEPVVAFLLAHGADAAVLNIKANRPDELAFTHGHGHVGSLLQRALKSQMQEQLASAATSLLAAHNVQLRDMKRTALIMTASPRCQEKVEEELRMRAEVEAELAAAEADRTSARASNANSHTGSLKLTRASGSINHDHDSSNGVPLPPPRLGTAHRLANGSSGSSGSASSSGSGSGAACGGRDCSGCDAHRSSAGADAVGIIRLGDPTPHPACADPLDATPAALSGGGTAAAAAAAAVGDGILIQPPPAISSSSSLSSSSSDVIVSGVGAGTGAVGRVKFGTFGKSATAAPQGGKLQKMDKGRHKHVTAHFNEELRRVRDSDAYHRSLFGHKSSGGGGAAVAAVTSGGPTSASARRATADSRGGIKGSGVGFAPPDVEVGEYVGMEEEVEEQEVRGEEGEDRHSAPHTPADGEEPRALLHVPTLRHAMSQ